MESKGTKCKTDAKVVAKMVADQWTGKNAHKDKAAGDNVTGCNYAS